MIPVVCPVCRGYVIEKIHDMCEVCGWFMEIDDYNDHSHRSAKNAYSIDEYKKKWAAGEISGPAHYDNTGRELTHEQFMETVCFPESGIMRKKENYR